MNRQVSWTRRAMVAAVALLLVTGLSSCNWAPRTRYVYPVFTTVDVTSNVLYRSTTDYLGNPIDLYLDVYRPHGDTDTSRPAVMWMYGGFWAAGNKSDMANYATDSAQRGYVGVSIQYRIRPGQQGKMDVNAAAYDAYDDAIAAVDWLKTNAATYGIDPNVIIGAGYSAGAINALNLLYVPGSRGPATSPVAASVAISGTSMKTPTAGDPPALMHHGDADTIVPIASGHKTCDAALAVADVCQFITYPGGDHFIVNTQTSAIESSTALFLWEKVLMKHGYKAVQVP